MSKRPCVLYVADAYCGWCFGFAPSLNEFQAANGDRVDFRVISGGLFVGQRVQPISQFTHIREANARIVRLTGVRFGPAYDALLEQGTFLMDSAAAAAGLAALRSQNEAKGIEFLDLIQQAFYGEGRSLSEPETYARIATASGLDADRTKHLLASGEAAQLAQADFTMARALGITTYPTLLLINGSDVHRLPATGTALEVMNLELSRAIAAHKALSDQEGA